LADAPARLVEDRWISVTASGEAMLPPDTALVTFAVSGNGADLEPVRAEVNGRSSAVLAALRQLGIAEADVDAPDITIQPEYDYRRGQRLTGYRVARNMTARVRELDRLAGVLDGIVAAGANEIGGARMTASDPTAGEHLALESAVGAARAKAGVLADAAGVALGAVIRIEEEAGWSGPPQPMFRAMATPEAADATDVVAGDLTVTRTVRIWFAIG
jgi:uncharacterized protein